MTRYTLKPRPPLRAFVVAAALSLVAAVVIVVGADRLLGWVTGIGIFVAALALALLLLAVGSMRTMRVHVDVDDEGYAISGPNIDKRGRWVDVTKLALADEGARLVFHHGPIERTHLWSPMGGNDPSMAALVQDVTKRLDASRGYSNLA